MMEVANKEILHITGFSMPMYNSGQKSERLCFHEMSVAQYEQKINQYYKAPPTARR